MKMLNRILLALCFLSVIGCSGKSEISPGVEHASPMQPATKLKQAKPGASVKLVSDSLVSINPNEKTNLDITLETQEPSGEMSIELSTTDGLSLFGSSHYQMTFASTAPIKIPVTILATHGRHHLNMHVNLNTGAAISTRNLAVIIQSGSDQKPLQRKKESDKRIISLPARETISAQ